MEMVFLNVDLALGFLAKGNTPLRVALGMLLKEEAVQDAEVKIFCSGGEIERMTFKSTHTLRKDIPCGDVVISVLSDDEENVCVWTSKAAAESVESVDKPASPTSKEDAVDATVKSEKSTADETLALKVGKVVLTVAAIGAAVGAGVWAWKKWGKSSN